MSVRVSTKNDVWIVDQPQPPDLESQKELNIELEMTSSEYSTFQAKVPAGVPRQPISIELFPM